MQSLSHDWMQWKQQQCRKQCDLQHQPAVSFDDSTTRFTPQNRKTDDNLETIDASGTSGDDIAKVDNQTDREA